MFKFTILLAIVMASCFFLGAEWERIKIRHQCQVLAERRVKRAYLRRQMHAHPGYYAFTKHQVNEASESILSPEKTLPLTGVPLISD